MPESFLVFIFFKLEMYTCKLDIFIIVVMFFISDPYAKILKRYLEPRIKWNLMYFVSCVCLYVYIYIYIYMKKLHWHILRFIENTLTSSLLLNSTRTFLHFQNTYTKFINRIKKTILKYYIFPLIIIFFFCLFWH